MAAKLCTKWPIPKLHIGMHVFATGPLGWSVKESQGRFTVVELPSEFSPLFKVQRGKELTWSISKFDIQVGLIEVSDGKPCFKCAPYGGIVWAKVDKDKPELGNAVYQCKHCRGGWL